MKTRLIVDIDTEEATVKIAEFSAEAVITKLEYDSYESIADCIAFAVCDYIQGLR